MKKRKIKKIKLLIMVMLILIEITSIFFIYQTNANKKTILNTVSSKKQKVSNSGITIMLEKEDGTGYEESTSTSFPTEGYIFNSSKSGCINQDGMKIENSIKFENGAVLVETDATSYCCIYFDLPEPSVVVNVSTNGVSNTLPTTNKYKATLACDGATSTYSTKYQRIEISQVGNTSTTCNLNYVADTNTYTLLKTKVESENTTTNDGYRYSGKEPNNWVWFNNEKWRIIGSIPVTLSDKTVDNRVKIIRAESIGGLAYHKSDANTTWGSGNTLYTLLNEKYYGKVNANGVSPCLGYSSSGYGLCNYEEIGISNSNSDYYGRMVLSVYMNAGTVSSTSKKIDAAYDLEVATLTSSTAKIGLMTASDYGYATSGITYSSVGLSSISGYEENNWLYGQGYEWTMTTYSTTRVLVVNYDGTLNYNDAYNGRTVRPSLYLDSSVYIISGEGSEENPYIIGM
ncbi:MAG: hypothetical protein IJ272_05020 [Clostridia bacterium]|nr:hypothetical protein [Clostridia bacterium]